MTIRQVMIFTRFERLWHWSQAASIITLMFTGLAVRGVHHLIDFKTAVMVHTIAALALLALWILATFWLFVTGDWRHYLPTSKGLFKVARFYAFGIFKGEHHPYRKVFRRKHNPLQALAYLSLKVVLFPAIWTTGIIYLLYFAWSDMANAPSLLEGVALIHTAAAFAILVFIILHIYLLTTGHSFREHVKPMITGYDEVDLTPEEEAFLEHDETRRIR